MSKNPAKGKKVALVTGGSRGIGEAIAIALANEGYAVAVNYRSGQSFANSVAERIRSAGGVADIVQGDVSSKEDVERMFTWLDNRFDGLDVLVNNAGWENVHHAIEMPLDDFRKAVDVNLLGPFHCAQLAARRMEHSGGGAIINNLSIHDSVPRKGLAHYCAAKAGQLMLTKCLALEWASLGIRVNAVSPGAIETDMNREEIEAFGRENFNDVIPSERIGVVDEISGIVVFLASPAASYVTGSTLYADGGYRLATVPYDPRPPRAESGPSSTAVD